MFATGDLRHLNVYAEVRGKYARPLPVNKRPEGNIALTPKGNPVISRPSTAGSLIARGTLNKRTEIIEKQPESSQSQRYNKRYRTVSQTVQPKVTQEVDRMVIDYPDSPKTAENQEKTLENLENPKSPENEPEVFQENFENPENFRDKMSEATGLTTTSQRKYILELEALLRQEKIRRINLEESLKKALEDN